MAENLRLLIIENCESDADLIVRALSKAGYDIDYERVENHAQMAAALENGIWDAIISNHNLPQFSSFEVLKVYSNRGLDIPFIVVAGTMGEEKAVDIMKAGAHDFILKGNLARLGSALNRELKEAEIRSNRRIEEDKFKVSSQQWRATFDAFKDAVCLLDNDSRVLRCNKAMRDMVGLPYQDIIGRHCWELVHCTEQRINGCPFTEMTTSGRTQNFIWESDSRWIETTIDPYFDDRGKLIGSVHTLSDVTFQVQVEEERRKNEERFHKLIESAPYAIFIQANGIFAYVNNAALKLFGAVKSDQLVGQALIDRIHPDSQRLVQDRLQRINEKKEAADETEEKIIQLNGTVISVSASAVPFEYFGRSGGLAFMRDITEQKRIEEEIKDWREKYQTVIENASEGITVSQDHIRKYVNSRYAEMLGYTVEELIEKPVGSIVHAHERDTILIRYEKIIAGEKLPASLTRVFKKDGSLRTFEFSVIPIMWDNKPALLSFATDITEKLQMQQELVESEQHFRTLANSGEALIWTSGIDKKCDYFNEPWFHFTGRTLEQEIGYGWMENVHPDDYDRCVDIYTKAFDKREKFSMVYRLRRRDGEYRYIRDDGAPRHNAAGQFIGYIGHCFDLTALKTAEGERERSYEKLQQTFKAMVESIAAISEFRDPYTAGHQRNVAKLAAAIAREMNLDEDHIEGLRIAALVHDIGKMTVPSEILSKPGKLTEIELSLIKSHPKVGWEILKSIDFPWPIAQIVLQHHLRIDGSGYPECEQGKEIMMEAKILAVADVVEAMSSHRPYRPSLGVSAALKEITENKGKLYDAEVVDTCLVLFREKGFTF